MVKKIAENWLEDNYKKDKDTTKAIAVPEGVELEGELVIDGYGVLEIISLENTKGITKLTIKNCPKVKAIYVPDNKIAEIVGLPDLPDLEILNFGKNEVGKIDVSKNIKLRTIIFHKNNPNLEFENGIKTLVNLTSLNSRETFVITKFLEQVSKKQLEGLAGKLNLDTKDKKLDDLKKLVEDEIDKIVSNEKKLKDKDKGLPNLYDDKEGKDKGKIKDDELKKVKDQIEKGEKYQKLLDDKGNSPIITDGKIDSTKLADALKEKEELKKKLELIKKKLENYFGVDWESQINYIEVTLPKPTN